VLLLALEVAAVVTAIAAHAERHQEIAGMQRTWIRRRISEIACLLARTTSLRLPEDGLPF